MVVHGRHRYALTSCCRLLALRFRALQATDRDFPKSGGDTFCMGRRRPDDRAAAFRRRRSCAHCHLPGSGSAARESARQKVAVLGLPLRVISGREKQPGGERRFSGNGSGGVGSGSSSGSRTVLGVPNYEPADRCRGPWPCPRLPARPAPSRADRAPQPVRPAPAATRLQMSCSRCPLSANRAVNPLAVAFASTTAGRGSKSPHRGAQRSPNREVTSFRFTVGHPPGRDGRPTGFHYRKYLTDDALLPPLAPHFTRMAAYSTSPPLLHHVASRLPGRRSAGRRSVW